MSLTKIAAFAGCVASVAAHGFVSGIVIDGTYTQNWSPSDAYASPAPKRIGWADTNLDLGFTSPSEYAGPNIICAQNAKNAALSATVAAGGSIDLQWNTWPESHHGPVITYLANCGGDCTTVDKTTLKFFKIDEGGLVDDSNIPGTWASDRMIANNNTWTVTIPSDLAAGGYVMRHEIIALHSAESANGAQNYPQCINLDVTGSGSLAPEGTLGEALYTPTDPGILVNIYAAISSYKIPGPAMYNATGSASATSAASVATSAVAASTTAISTSAVPSTLVTSVASATSAAAIPTSAASDDDDSCDA
ncbi:hypothetical protein ACMFMG_008720 [Clarireedia jacksonii]